MVFTKKLTNLQIELVKLFAYQVEDSQLLEIKSVYRPIFDALLAKKYTLVISNEILAEYEEIFSQRANPKVANLVLEALGVHYPPSVKASTKRI
jgi:hypothetical protein